MNHKYLTILTLIVLITGLNSPITHTQSPLFVTTFTFNDVLVKRSLLSLSQVRESVPPSLTDRGAPRDRKGGASHFSTQGS